MSSRHSGAGGRRPIARLASVTPFGEDFIRFALVGSSGVVVNNLVLFGMHELAGLALPAASLIAIETSIVTNFLLNDRWTFGRRRPGWARFVRFNIVSAGGLVVNLTVLNALVALAGLHYLPANLAGIGAALAWNFLVNVRWTWGTQQVRSGWDRIYETGDTMANDLVIVPTYNEAENLPPVVEEILDQGDFDVLVVDDASPDGTGRIADDLAERRPGRVRVLHRAGKDGLGSAYRAGFGWALARGYDRVYQMDADRSHDPRELPRLRAALGAGADAVLGSRWVEGGEVRGWPLWRLAVSRLGSGFARTVLGLAQRDLTGGFKAFRRPALEAIKLDETRSNGYAFQIETTYRVLRAGGRVEERPITFTDRVQGKSKMGLAIIVEAVRVVVGLGIRPPVVDRIPVGTGSRRRAADG